MCLFNSIWVPTMYQALFWVPMTQMKQVINGTGEWGDKDLDPHWTYILLKEIGINKDKMENNVWW